MIDCFVKNKTVLETAHDQYETYLNDANSPYESELYSFHVARVQKWIHIIGNRLHYIIELQQVRMNLRNLKNYMMGGMTYHMMFLVLKLVNLIFTRM